MKYLLGVVAALAVSYAIAEEVRLLDLEPDVAQQYIENKDQTLKYAPKIESNVPAVRFLGNEPHQVVEDIYLANQYHGQDGLGGYLYGYSVPDIAKTEKKKAGGDLRGSYNYINGQGQEIKVEYWDDGTGFHQIDNVPKFQPKQIDDTPEVKAAKEEHARIWQEQALRNSQPVQYPFQGNQYKPEIAALINGEHKVKTPGVLPTNTGFSQGNINNIDYSGQYTEPQGQFVRPQGSNQGPGAYNQQGQGAFQQSGFNKPNPGFNQQGAYNKPGSQGAYNQQGSQGGYNPQGNQGNQGAYNQQGFGHQGGFNQQGSQGAYNPQGANHQQVSRGAYNPQGSQGAYNQQASQGAYNPQGSQGAYNQQASQGAYNPQASQGAYNQGSQGAYNPQASQGAYTPEGSQGAHGQHGSEGVHPNLLKNDHENEDEEEKGPPRGFFYQFDYPVGIIVGKDGVQKRESITELYKKEKEALAAQLKSSLAH